MISEIQSLNEALERQFWCIVYVNDAFIAHEY